MTLSRRRLLAAALAAGAAGPLTAAGPASAAPGRARLTLPAPTGPYRVGTVSLHLIDRSRPDRVAGPGHYHELMASIWYPALPDARRYPAAAWLQDAPMRGLLANSGLPADVAAAPLTAGREGAPALRALGRRPVLVFSHGANGHRSETTIIVQELASRGYVVVTVDTTYDAFTEFPGGRVSAPNDDLAEILDLRRIGMFGYSKGGTATPLAMIGDQRIRAGLSLDGPMECQPPITADIDRPFMMMTADFTRARKPSAADFWTHLHGWRRNLEIDGGTEISYSDAVWLLPQIARLTGMSDEDLAAKWIGTFSPSLAVKIQQTYPLAFFDLHLRHRRQPLLEGSSPPFPGVHFIP